MARISAKLKYGNDLWLDYKIHANGYRLDMRDNIIGLNAIGQSVIADAELSDDQKITRVKALAKEDPALPPQWQEVPAHLQRVVERMASQLIDAANDFDGCLRRLPKAAQLSPVTFEPARTSGGQEFPVFYWHFDDDDKELLAPIFAIFGEQAVNGYRHRIQVPMPHHFNRMQVHLSEADIDELKELTQGPQDTQVYRTLYGLALESFVRRSYEAAVLVLATAIETALKAHLIGHSDGVGSYLIDNIQSPQIEKLYSCARKEAGMGLPKHFTSSLHSLRNSRNDTAHKPHKKEFNSLLVARWFAVGEAIVSYREGVEVDDCVSRLVKAAGEKAAKNYPPNSKGVVLRKEFLAGQDWYHIVMDTGEGRRFRKDEFELCEDQSISL